MKGQNGIKMKFKRQLQGFILSQVLVQALLQLLIMFFQSSSCSPCTIPIDHLWGKARFTQRCFTAGTGVQLPNTQLNPAHGVCA